MHGEAKAQKGHTHKLLDLNPGSPAPESALLTPRLNSALPLKIDHKVKAKNREQKKV